MFTSTTSDLRTEFVRSQVYTTAGMPIALGDFIEHHFTPVDIMPMPHVWEESIVIKLMERDELKEKRIAAAQKMDEIRKQIGLVDIKVADLIREAREERMRAILKER